MKPIVFREIESSKGFWSVMAVLGLVVALAGGAFLYMEHSGHWVTGMNNQVVWGMPHVFAIFLIIAASGALNIASISSVFNKKAYKPLSRMSAVLAISLLAGGLVVLLLDLGRADRLIVAITKYNFKSIFAWNIILYSGFFVIVLVYLWTMMEPAMNKLSRVAGTAAFIWRLVLTTGTGSIFGFLVARQAYDAAILAPLFIVMSFAFGQAIFMLLLLGIYKGNQRELGDVLLTRMRNLLGVFVAAILFLVTIYHVTNLYATEHHGVEQFILLEGGRYTILFWLGQVLIGGVLPLILIYGSKCKNNIKALIAAAIMIIIGGFSQIYVLLIGGQAYPLSLFPGKEVSSSFSDGIVNLYNPSAPEILLGVGGVALAIGIFLFASLVLRIVPENLSNTHSNPHYKAEPSE